MGKISQGVLGGFSGKLGNVVGASWKGIDYMRIKPANVANPKTQGQLDQRSKFALVLNFLQSMTVFVRLGFKLYATKKTQFNSAMSYLLGNAITGAYPDFTLDYSKVLVSKGNLTGAVNASAVSDTPGEVAYAWDDNSGSGSAAATDVALLLAYSPAKNISVYLTSGAVRSDGAATLNLPNDFSGDDVEVYLGFMSGDATDVANSVHLGTVTVA